MTSNLMIPVGRVSVAADLHVPTSPRGIVAFAHGSGSSRHSPRNRMVAERLRARRFATLLADLLTPDEERIDQHTGRLRFDIELLTDRVVGIIDRISQWHRTVRLPIGLFGASTGAAAALLAAARRPDLVRAVVSRGGRPDLAATGLAKVTAPTLLIVGGADPQVLELNRQAAGQIAAVCRLHVVPGAGHLFEGSGALEEVAERAAEWFGTYLPPAAEGEARAVLDEYPVTEDDSLG